MVQTDDVGVFCSTCSNEYYLVAQHFGLGEKDLWELAFGAVVSIFGGEKVKEKLRELFTTWKDKEGF
jgi:adenosine deaminase